MSVDFEDYYEVLGVDRDASQDEIQKAYRKKARKYHPDVSKEPDAEEMFKKVNEAHEVLKDPETRKKYDQLGQNWKSGQGFEPPPGWGDGWENVRVNMGGGGFEDIFGGAGGGGGGGFSDFFNMFFGGGGPAGAGGRGGRAGGGRRARGQRQQPGAGPGFGGFGGGRSGQGFARKGRSHEAEVTVSLEDVMHGAEKHIAMPVREQTADGRVVERQKTYKVKIPAGTTDGTVIRLAGQGEPGVGGGKPGDLLLKVRLAPHSDYDVDGHNLTTKLYLAPWEAALGTKATLQTPDGDVTVTVPEGSQSGNKLRLRGRGLPKKGADGRGNLYVELLIRVPDELSERERELFEQLREASSFDARH